MIKYIFNLDEIKFMFYIFGGQIYKCDFFDMKNYTQSEYDRGLESLLFKGVIKKIDNETIVPDWIFEEVFRVLVSSDYTIMNDGFLVAISDIVILIEKDERGDDIFKLCLFQDLKALKEYIEIKDSDLLKIYIGSGQVNTRNIENMFIFETISYLEELLS